MNTSAIKKAFPAGRVVCFVLVVTTMAAVIAAQYFKVQISATATNVTEPLPEVMRTHVFALGRLEPAGTVLQLMPRSGNEGATVERLFVREGDDVEAGATLAVMDNQSRRIATLKESQARLEAARAGLLRVKAGAKTGDVEAQQAVVALIEEQSRVSSRELSRVKELQKRNATTIEMIEQKQWEYDRLRLEARRAAAQLESLREIRDVDVLVAEKDVRAAEAAVAKAEADAAASELPAPVAARVLRIHTYPGEQVSDAGIMELGNVRQMQAVAEVFEADIPILQLGMASEVRVDASGELLRGRITDIGHIVARKAVLTNDPVSDTDARVVEVRIQLDADTTERVARLSNARVEVRILLEQSDRIPDRKSSGTELTNGAIRGRSRKSSSHVN